MNTQAELYKLIDAYTQKHRVMPTVIRGPFSQLIHIWSHSNQATSGEYVTPLGNMKAELDVDAPEWYVD